MRVPLPPPFLARPLAHRALHGVGRPENSLSAVRAAVAAGYGIEVDVQPSADRVAMVFHDEALDRLTRGAGPVAARTAADLARLPLLGGDGEGVPTLREVLGVVGGRVPLLVEVKDQDGAMGPAMGGLPEMVAEAAAGYRGPLAVMSFNPHAVAALRDLLPGLARGLTTSAFDPADWAPLPPEVCDRLRGVPDYDAVEASFVSHEAADLARARVQELRAAGAAILCWTIRSASAERAARAVAHNVTFEGYPA